MALLSRSAVTLLLCTIGIYISFFSWAWFQERVTSTSYASTVPGEPDAKFSFIKVLNLSQCVAAAVVGFVFCLFTGHSFTLRPLGYFLTISATQTLGSPFSYIAMNYITYPMVTLVKSCKLVPVMVMGALIGGKRFSLLEYFCCLMITLGVVLFTCLKPNMGTETGSLLSVAIGCGLVVINLSFDGMTNALQDKVYKLHHISAGQMMCVMNVIGAVFLAAAMVSPVDPDVAFDMITGEATTGSLWRGFAFNEVVEAMQFLTTHPEALRDVLLFALCGATGQVFIFINIKQFGSLINTIVTITRKFFSIFFSLLYFGHKFNAVQVFGILLVFGGLGIDIWIHSKHPRKHKEEAGGKAVADDKKKD